jgi:hypothetical protein
MATAYELALEQSQTSTRNGKDTAQRRFRVDDISPDAALNADGIPVLGSQHPTRTDLLLDAYSVNVDASGTCVVECNYSNDARFIDMRRQPNRDAPTWYHWGWSQRKVMVDIPVCIRSVVLNNDANGNEIQKKVWKIGKKQVAETRVIRPLTVRVNVSNVRNLDVIAEQTDTLHNMPDGKWYHFEGANVTQVDDIGNYDISYTWEYDAGTFYFPVFGSQDADYCDFVDGVAVPTRPTTGDMFRNPYTVFVAYQLQNPETTKPVCILNDLYPTGDSPEGPGKGWKLLPGANRIL